MTKWISVKDWLPERDKHVLIFARGMVDVGYLESVPIGPHPLWWRPSWIGGPEYDIDWQQDWDNDVTHWAELPEGPTDV